MNTPMEDRKLAAILSIDLVGYSSLMREDEGGTLTRLRDVREKVIGPVVKTGNGRIFKTLGDGLLIEFGSVSDSVQCALDIQAGVADWNKSAKGNGSLAFRIGINLADVIPDADDLLGDGVNIAARIEALAAPSGICISGAVYDQVKQRFPDRFKRLGRKKLKNIDEQIEVYGTIVGSAGPVWGRHPFRIGGTQKRWLTSGAVAASLLIAVAGGYVLFFADTAGEPATVEEKIEQLDAEAKATTEKARAEAEAASAKAVAAATVAEAEAKLEVMRKTVEIWKKASLDLAEAAEAVREAEVALAVALSRETAQKGMDASSGKNAERLEDVGKARQELEKARARYEAMLAGEKRAKQRMNELQSESADDKK